MNAHIHPLEPTESAYSSAATPMNPRIHRLGRLRVTAGDSGHQKIPVHGHAFPIGGQFDSRVAANSSLNVTVRLSI